MHIDGVFSGPCNELKAGVHAPLASPDMYNTDEGWSGISSLSRIQCARSGTSGWTSVEITECASVAHAGDGRWVVTADACTATVSEIDRRSERRIGEYRISFEFFAQEAG